MDRENQKLTSDDDEAGPSEPAMQLRGGYQAVFTCDVREQLKCPVCLLVLRDAVQTPCGHLFCESCLQPILRGKQPRCPMDQKELLSTFPDRSTRRFISQLGVQCDHYDKCGWKGVLGDLEGHLKVCPFVVVACENVGCSEKLQRHKMLKHQAKKCLYRHEMCGHCRESIPAANLETHIAQDCPVAPIPCPIGQCKVVVPRQHLTKHVENDCQEMEVRCEFGCGQMVMRRKLEEHMMDPKSNLKHMRHMHQRLATAEDSDRRKSEVIEQLEMKVINLQEQLDGRHAEGLVENLSKELGTVKQARQASPLVQGKLEEYQSKQRALERDFHDVSLAVRGMKVSLEKYGVQETRLARQIDLLDLRTLELETATYDATLLWKISHFSQLLTDARNGVKTSHYSQPFYTSRHGYKACARLYPNGDGAGAGSHVSLFFVVMAGQYDAILPWPFRQRITFTLVDQAPSSRHHIAETFMPDASSSSFQQPRTGMNVASGCPCFVSHQTLRSSLHKYIQDDTIFLRVKIETNGL